MSNHLDPDQARHFVGLDLVQTVCKGYQQTALEGKELNLNSIPATLKQQLLMSAGNICQQSDPDQASKW